ncbi:unnamed protein product [Prorocentrum cordatum]|uniref:STT3/PglB/AglB core domain-containing protein n=1 Tax=Prorocentrum cordatum TaxID=2364126 RepID=A0ABN9VGV1_9DINO|nr:unnamed protein product [Polarella glacialis]
MSRLLLICGPVCSVACAMWFGLLLDFLLEPFLLLLGKPGYRWRSMPAASPGQVLPPDAGAAAGRGAEKQKQRQTKKKPAEGTAAPSAAPAAAGASAASELAEWEEELRPGGAAALRRLARERCASLLPAGAARQYAEAREYLDSDPVALIGRAFFSATFLLTAWSSGLAGATVSGFVSQCDAVARELSDPQVVFQTTLRNGTAVVIDDYLKGYQWVEQNTPEDARVMAWWDYGYQITGIAKRTSIADGNTWNHEHIATLGRLLTSPERRAWSSIRHLADYVLVWAGGHGDDIGKSAHLARIGNSVFPDHCGDDDPRLCLCRRSFFRIRGRHPLANDAQVVALQARSARHPGCGRQREPVQGGAQVSVWPAARVSGGQRFPGEQGVGVRPQEQGLRRPRELVLRRAVPTGVEGADREQAQLRPARGLQQGRRPEERVHEAGGERAGQRPRSGRAVAPHRQPGPGACLAPAGAGAAGRRPQAPATLARAWLQRAP